ncbi:winged helix DNA-binding domain-containing protein [Corynebacterium glyciniphilum]|uniref:winged helix DNA-binding domain-containing protein n=1 Tax=Corynebacterium glyciniphilum TaxID=1404244 RepID=UPI002654AF5E|nr:winged helix DNA-binding domain-containing protein [Corynebacterium glyciniphilum]MDN5684940.1 winged helix DNA-binding domain-containing protein [Corynebacterium glyciniphilum]MDN6706487.1 winged helix DNA-binding domain-containing protein [Corynebacterium glyciniphilum]
MTSLSADRLRGLRLIAQLLAPSHARPLPAAPDIHAAAVHMLAMQSQNLRAGVTALGVRAGVTDLDIAALDDAGVVRSWSQRGTHHLLAAEDVRWMTRLCTPRVQAASKKRRGGLGLSDSDVDTCRTALLARLTAAPAPLPRSEAYLVFAEAGVDPDGGRGPHMLRHFGGEGEIIQGPRSIQSAGTEGASGAGRSEDTFVLHDAVVSHPRGLTGKDALRELAVRYYRSRGPATVKDLAWWSGLTLRDVRAATALALDTGAVVTVEAADGRTLHMADWQQDVTDAEVDSALGTPRDLPAFDEYLLGYTDRSDVMTDTVAAEVGPTKNGLFHAFHVENGTVTGRS